MEEKTVLKSLQMFVKSASVEVRPVNKPLDRAVTPDADDVEIALIHEFKDLYSKSWAVE